LEGTLKKLALVASAATVLICSASLIATPVDAKSKKHAKKPAATTSQQMAAGPGGYNAGPRHDPGGPMTSGTMCWKDKDAWANTGQGYWAACPKK
jgi:hypothetical protein